MKKILLLLLIPIVHFSCDKDEPALFSITVPLTDFNVFTTFNEFDRHFIPGNDGFAVTVNVAQQIADAGFEMSDFSKIVPGAARISANFNEERLDFIRAMSIRVCQEIGTNNSCAQEVFYRDPVPDNPGFAVNLIPSAVDDVQETVIADELFIQLVLEELWFNPPSNFSLRLEMTFDVK